MSASMPQRSTTFGNYSFAHNPPTPHSNQHNTDASFGSSPPAMGGSKCASQMLGPNDHSSSASSQRIATMSDSMRAVVPMMADTNVFLWMSDSPSSRNAILHSGSPYNSPTPHDLGGPEPPVIQRREGSTYLHVHSQWPIGHTLPMSSQCNMTTSNTHSVVPMMENPNAASWAPNNLGAAASLGWPGESQFVPYLHELGGASIANAGTDWPYFVRALAMGDDRLGYTFCRSYDDKFQRCLADTKQSQDLCLTWPLTKRDMCS
ncbi:uncharacterized protein F5891DRAFT_1189149 [Suillus fuscotomentosus]|uniref:Uncharacterized protein n=1 Tax=Suillus fuscotomentosus TaxID=1912939 RepID=A0AAD4E693_9AGAM|nr:uncharacterized protein F5891DRAFT_1189149 [Suillus fuscotomentosus]KAG1900061.1 hypothetical protein F5891DRAFT_1189149 [Suillus fuscotomentosus]